MADDTPAVSETGAETAEQDQQQQTPDVPPEIKAALRKANKEAETLRLKLKEIEDREKTEAQRLAERAEAAERAAAERALELLRYKVGVTKQLPPALVGRLQGATEEEMSADADALLEQLRATFTSQPSGSPARSIDQGTRTDMPLNGDGILTALKRAVGSP